LKPGGSGEASPEDVAVDFRLAEVDTTLAGMVGKDGVPAGFFELLK